MKMINVSVNLSKLVRELPSYFGDKYAFVTELVQNAYRAGAARIDITATPTSFAIKDNGHGISDPEVLFRIAESSWQDHVIKNMSPAGVGIFSAFMSADNVLIKSCNGSVERVIEVAKTDLQELRPVEVKETAGDYRGTYLCMNGVYDMGELERAVKTKVVYLTHLPDGRKMEIYLNGKLLEQEHFFNQKYREEPRYIKEISAGTLALYNCYTCVESGIAFYHGQLIRLAEQDKYVVQFRLIVKGSGLTPRLPDRSTFVDDEKMSAFKKEYREAVREAIKQNKIEIRPEIAEEYLTQAEMVNLVPASITCDMGDLELPAFPGSGSLGHKMVYEGSVEEVKKYKFIVSYDFNLYDNDNDDDVKALAALKEFNDIGFVSKGVAQCCKNAEFLKRLRTPADFKVVIKKEGTLAKFGFSEIIAAKVTLVDKITKEKLVVETVVPERGADYSCDVSTFYWSFKDTPKKVGYHEVYARLEEACKLVTIISDDDQREYAFETDFEDTYAENLKAVFDTVNTIILNIKKNIGLTISNIFDTKEDVKGFDIRYSSKKGLELTVTGSKSKYTLKNGKWGSIGKNKK